MAMSHKFGRWKLGATIVAALLAASGRHGVGARGTKRHHRAARLPAIRSKCGGVQSAALLSKTLAFAQDNEREFIQGVGRGLSMAAKDRGLAYSRTVAKMTEAR